MSWPGCLWKCAALCLAALTAQVALAQAERHTGVATADELFHLFGMDEDFFQKFRDDTSWKDDEQEPLMRVLVRLAQIKPADLARWTVREFKNSDIANHPRNFSGQILGLEGRVVRVTPIEPPVEQQNRYDLEKFYRCEIDLINDAGAAVVFAVNIPKHWKLNAPISEPISAAALFLKRGPQDNSRGPVLCFAADRIAWHPDTLLGNLRMDYSLFDTVRHDRAITDSERECFYQVLAAAGRAPAEEQNDLVISADDTADATARLVALMARPEAHEGELHSFRGVARRAVKIQITDPETIARFGVDHYFELVVFVELDGYADIGGKNVNSHPVVFCLRELPAGMPTGENIAEMVRASGFMFKKWRYTTQLVGKKGTGLRVASPLLIGKQATWERRAAPPRRFDPIVGGSVVGAIACTMLFVWWYSRRERRIHDEVFARRRAATESARLDDLKLDSIEAASQDDRV
jgi:hypothetical protein